MQTILWQIDKNKLDEDVLVRVAQIIKNNCLVAFPTETVYGLGANGLSAQAVEKIFTAKGRPSDNPLILHIADQKDLQRLVREVPVTAKKLMEKFWPGSLTIVFKKAKNIPDAVTAGLDTVAIRMPEHPIALSLIRLAGVPIAAPSANISGRPSPTQAKAVVEDLWGKIDGIIDGGSTQVGLESTVVDCSDGTPVLLRPGAVTKEDLLAVLDTLEDGSSKKENVPRSPGMKYKHYAPKAPMYVVTEDIDDEQFLQQIRKLLAKNIKIGVLAEASFIPKVPKEVISYGFDDTNISVLAANLYSWLRCFDEKKVSVILARGVGEVGLGLAVMNRLTKAAGLQKIASQEEFDRI